MPDLPLLELLYKALGEEHGLVLEVGNMQTFKNKFYQLRKTDPDLSVLSCVVSPTAPNSEVWIVKRHEQLQD